MVVKDTAAEFERLKPWVTKFTIGGREYGGTFDAMNDGRINQFLRRFPDAKTVLELGSLEGGHTFAVARRETVERVVGVEGRQANVDRARCVQRLLGANNVEFVTANIESFDLRSLGMFDAVFCVGLLYHLPRPWEVIARIAQVTRSVFIWTHYASDEKADRVASGYRGLGYKEFGMADPLSGMSRESFWPTLDALRLMLSTYGFTNVQIIEDKPDHPNGPAVTLAATSPQEYAASV